jgi:hypothetical protein
MTQPAHCPITGAKGKKVNGATLKCMLSVSLRQVQDVNYYFCRDATCDVVYFSEDGQQVFRKHEIRELVYQKESQNPHVPICYCFGHTQAQIAQDIKNTGTTPVVQNIKSGIQTGQCACDWRNPQGDCCLGNVLELVKRLK